MNHVLDAYAAHCDRQGYARVWSTHRDIWNEPQGELGLTYTDDDYQALAVFAALVPFMLIPTIGESWLVVDHPDLRKPRCSVIRMAVEGGGLLFEPSRVPYSIGDDGAMSFGKPKVGHRLDANSTEALREVFKGRMARVGWSDEIGFDQAVLIAEGLLT